MSAAAISRATPRRPPPVARAAAPSGPAPGRLGGTTWTCVSIIGIQNFSQLTNPPAQSQSPSACAVKAIGLAASPLLQASQGAYAPPLAKIGLNCRAAPCRSTPVSVHRLRQLYKELAMATPPIHRSLARLFLGGCFAVGGTCATVLGATPPVARCSNISRPPRGRDHHPDRRRAGRLQGRAGQGQGRLSGWVLKDARASSLRRFYASDGRTSTSGPTTRTASRSTARSITHRRRQARPVPLAQRRRLASGASMRTRTAPSTPGR